MRFAFCWAFLLVGGFCSSAYAQNGNDQGGIVVTGDPAQVGNHDQGQGGTLVIPDEQDPPSRPQPAAAHAATGRDEEAHKRLAGHDRDIAGLRTGLAAYKEACQQERRFSYRGDKVRVAAARTKKVRARSLLRRKGVSEKAFSDPALFKALEAALKSGKLDGLLKGRLNTWMADPGTTLGRMFAAYQDHEKILYGDPNDPNDGLVKQHQEMWAWYEKEQKALGAKPINPPASDPPAPADTGTSEPPTGTGKPAPPAVQPQGGEKGKAKSTAEENTQTPEKIGMGLLTVAALGAAFGWRRRIANAQ